MKNGIINVTLKKIEFDLYNSYVPSRLKTDFSRRFGYISVFKLALIWTTKWLSYHMLNGKSCLKRPYTSLTIVPLGLDCENNL